MKHSKLSPGFSLILSLTVMAGLVMLIVTVSAFITIESRAAMNHQLATRARLNAIVSMRLALAHLQQEAGPDRRSTARADITQPDATASTVRNPMWTGIWRSDFPDLPPAWLVSGRGDQLAGTQSVSLFQTEKAADYHAGYWAPWQSGYNPGAETMVNLVGAGSAAATEGSRPSGLVALPKVALPDDRIKGNYAYWIGDEGIKARINLIDGRSTTASAADRLLALRSPVVADLGALKGLDTLTRPEQLGYIDSARQLGLLSGFNSGAATDPDPIASPEKNYFHDLSFVSAGVIADSFNGGLKRDLSLAFELSDDAFADTEFGEGKNLAGTTTPDGSAGTHTENGFGGRTKSKGVDDPLMMAIVTGSNSNGASGSANNLAAVAAPVFSRTVTAGQLRGPAWWALRDYHRLYQQLGWSSGATGTRGTSIPELRARTFWPNVAISRPSGNPEDYGLHDNGIRNRAYSYSDIYDGDLPSTLNPNASDFLGGNKGRLVTRPLHVAATPYVQRVSLAFSFSKSSEKVLIQPPFPYRGPPVVWTKNYIYLNVTPVVVIHNPYNVRMQWQPTSTSANGSTAYPAVVSLSNMDGWAFRMRSNTAEYSIALTKLLRTNGRIADSDDVLRLYLGGDATNTSITLEPGELRAFSCQPIANSLSGITPWVQTTATVNRFTAGRAMEISEVVQGTDGSFSTINEEEPFFAEILAGPSLRMRHALDCWPGDQLFIQQNGGNSANDKLKFFLNSSEHSELVVNEINASAGRAFSSVLDIPHKYVDKQFTSTGPTEAPTPFAVIDIAAKTANTDRAPFPLFTHSNPMAGSLRASGAGRTAADTNKGTRGSAASFSVNARAAGNWGEIIQQPDIERAFGGYSVNYDKGSERVILTEVPLVQPTSLAQYAHANFGVRDQQPLLSVGNSFASPLVDAVSVVESVKSDAGADVNWTEFDQNYLLNAALWDGFFLSSLAPWMKTEGTTPSLPERPRYKKNNDDDDDDDDDDKNGRGRGIKFPEAALAPSPNVIKPLSVVISDFIFKGTPLDNPRFSIELTGLDAAAAEVALKDYRRSATALLNKGAFNVNSTSVEAWKTFLGSTKQNALQGLAANSPSATDNARFLRTLTRQDTVPATGNAEDKSNWQGFANLSDTQIEKLAKAIVAENKDRFGISVRGERDKSTPPGPRRFGGSDKSTTPYLGLSEFINRFLCPETRANRCGALQAAIFRADDGDSNDTKGLSDRLYNGLGVLKLDAAKMSPASSGTLATAETPWFRYAANIEVGNGGRVHTALGAPGNLLQSDLLQSLGSALATRSDTFTLRCFGEAQLPSGETGEAWMEVVVQRTPEFIDRTNPAESGSSALKPLGVGAPTSVDPTTNRNLTPINNILGRRFKAISMRWLKTDEI